MIIQLKPQTETTKQPGNDDLVRGRELYEPRYGTYKIITRYIPGPPVRQLGQGISTGGGQVEFLTERDGEITRGRVHEAVVRDDWRIIPDIAADEYVAAMEKTWTEQEKARQKKQQLKIEEDQRQEQRGAEILARYRPLFAKAAIVAEYEQDECDIMTDYFATKTTQQIIIGWSDHTRNLFPEMRKAAAASGLPQLERFATPPDTDRNGEKKTEENASWWHPRDEHRENYSMGAGMYLKATDRYSSGWIIKKYAIGENPGWLAMIAGHPDGYKAPKPAEDKQPAATATGKPAGEKPLNSAVAVAENSEKRGLELSFAKKPAAAIRDRLKENGWRWHGVKKIWYGRDTTENRVLVEQIMEP